MKVANNKLISGSSILDEQRKKRSKEMLELFEKQAEEKPLLRLPEPTTKQQDESPLAAMRGDLRASTPLNPYRPTQKFDEMLQPVAATVADIYMATGQGLATGVEGIVDAGATVGAWGAKAFGADDASARIQQWIAEDWSGELDLSDHFIEQGSLLGKGLGGRLIRGAASGVGQMLPSVAVALIPGVGAAGALTTLGVSAAGSGVDEALSEGAGLGAATLYGAANAGVELVTEKLTGGMGKVFGAGFLDDVTGSVLKTGAGRVIKEAVGEGVEEGLSEIASPALKSIYKGVDAFSEYGDKDYWGGVGEAALIGAATSAAYGGTVGKALGTSGKAADVSSLAEDIKRNTAERMELYREGKITEGDENDRRTSRTMLADYRKLEEILQKADAAERSRLIKANNLSGVVDESGAVRPEVLASLTIEGVDSQTLAEEQNATEGKKTPLTGAYLSPGLWRQSGKVQSDLEGISADLKASGKEGKTVELFRGELSEAARENYNAFKRAASKLSMQSDSKLQFALIDAPSGVSGVHRGGTVYLNAATLEDGKWASVLFEEATHFTDGTAEAGKFKEFLIKEDGLFEDVADGLLKEGNAYGFTDENVTGDKSEAFNREIYAQMASRVLTSPEYVDKLVRADRTLAEKIRNRISDVAEALRSVTSKDVEVRKQLRRATKAQGLFERALEGADKGATGFLFAGGKAATADKLRLSTAKEMLANGADPETVRKETGWHQGYDEEWRFEIDDIDMKISTSGGASRNPDIRRYDELVNKVYFEDTATEQEREELRVLSDNLKGTDIAPKKLGDLIDHPDLFAAYPQLEEIDVYFAPNAKSGSGSYHPGFKEISLAQTDKLNKKKLKETLIHEIQHAVQDIENFASGSNPDQFVGTSQQSAYDQYRSTAGEIEARDAASRADLDAEQRKNTRPDIDREDVVFVKSANGEMSTQKSDFSMENVSEEADQQTSGDLAFGAEDLYPGWGEKILPTREHSQEAVGSDDAAESEKKEERKAPRTPAKVTYDNVNDMLREIRERHLEFEVNGRTVRGTIARKDAWALSKEIYEYLRENEQTPSEETSVEVARMILNAAKVDVWRTFNNEDGTTTRERVTEPLSKRIGAEQKKQIVTGVSNVISGLRGEYRAQKEARAKIKEVKAEARERINKKEEFIQELRLRVRKERREMLDRNRAMQGMAREVARVISLKGDKYTSASDVKNEAFTGAMKEIAKMNWRGGVVNGDAVRKHFSALVSWYTPENALYGAGGKANERYRFDIAFAIAEIASGEGEMTAEEIRAASEVIRYFAKEIEDYGTIYKDGKRVEAQPVIKKYIGKIEKANQIAVRSSNITKLFRSKFARLYGDPAMLMRLADSYVEGGFFTEQFEQMRKGTIRAAVLERELLEDFERFWSGKDAKEYGKRYNGTEVDFMGNKIPLAEAISLYMTLGRDHALSGAAYAGFEIEGEDGTVNVSDGFAKIVEIYRTETLDKLSPEEQLTLTKDENALIEERALREAADYVRAEIAKSFTAQDRRLIEITERIMERCRDYKVDVDEILYGESNVTGGYYYPVKRAGLAESVDVTSMFEGDRVSNLSINKETVKNAHKLLIEPAHVVLMRHVKAISLYDGLGVFTDNFNRLYNLNISENKNNPTTIRTSLGRSSQFAKDMLSYFKEMKQDVEGISKRRTAERWYNDAVGVIRSGYATYQLGANPKTWLTQVSSLVASTNILDADTLAKGLSVKDKADVDKYCRLAWLRNNEGAAVLAQSVTTGVNPVQKAGRDALQKVRDISMLPIGKMDRLVVRTLWGACQVQVEKDGGAAVGTEKNKKAAGELLERVILETQQNSLATERSAAMRSSDELLKATTMFRSDAMKIGARWIDAVGKMYSIGAQIRIARESLSTGDTSARAELERLQREKKTAAKACRRASATITSTALFSALLALGWKWLMDRDDEESVSTFVFDVIGNLIGGVPVFSDVYSFFVDGFEVENFLFDTVNNVLGAVADCADMLTDAVSGKEVTKQDAMKNLKKLVYALGQISGLPTRNVYNFITGIVSRFSPEAGLWIEMQFSSRSVAGDLEKAIEADDDNMVDTIIGIMLDQGGGEMSESVRRATAKLLKAGEEGILPRSIPEKLIGADDVEITLTGKQRQQFAKVYSAAYKAAADLVRMGYFKRATKEEQAYALKFIWSTYSALAKDTVLGEDSTKKNVLFAEAIPVERLALIAAQAAGIKADLNKDGKPISGSRMHKIEALLESLDLRAAQKYMMMGYLGYTNKNGRDIVERHIRTLGLSKTEQEELLEMSGYKE
jgi:hypothetical protein